MIEEDNKTLWCGNLPEQATEELLYELFLQAGPLERVRIPKDRDGRQKNFAFITFCQDVSVPYAINLFRGTALFHKTLSLQCRGRMALLPPPIRCYGPDPAIDFNNQIDVTEQFANMSDNLKDDSQKSMHGPRQSRDLSDKLTIASLQGNWTYRHHPYRSKDGNPHRDEYRLRDNRNESRSNSKHSSNWRDRRHHKKGNNYHRRD